VKYAFMARHRNSRVYGSSKWECFYQEDQRVGPGHFRSFGPNKIQLRSGQ
jgi:hypothetical protein